MKNQRNKARNVPNLRFPGFEGEWVEKKLGEVIISVKSGKSKHNDSGTFPLYGSTGIIGKTLCNTHCGTFILVARVGANAGQINIADGKFSLTDNTLIIEHEKKFNTVFLNSFLIKFNLNRLVFGSGQPLITSGLLKRILIAFPTPPEQQKIASFLTVIDTRINTQSKIIKEYQLLRQGLMQKIFSQEIRFKDKNGNPFPDWEEKKLGGIGEIFTGKTPKTSDKKLWNGSIDFITPTDINDSEKYQKVVARTIKSNDKLKVLPINSLVYTCIASIGKMALTTKPAVTNQQINSIVVNHIVSSEYLYYALRNLTPIIKATQANTTLPIINKTDFSKFKVKVPCKSEQQKIAGFLSSIDRLIEKLDRQMNLSQEWKKGLLQKMFV